MFLAKIDSQHQTQLWREQIIEYLYSKKTEIGRFPFPEFLNDPEFDIIGACVHIASFIKFTFDKFHWV